MNAASSSLPKSTQEYLDHGEQPGNRNNALLAAACQLRDNGYILEEAEGMLLPRALADGLSASGSRSTIRSAYSRSPREPSIGGSPFHPTSNYSNGNGKPKTLYRKTIVKPEPLPTPVDNSAIRFLESKFGPEEWVCIGYGYVKTDEKGNKEMAISGGVTRTRESWISDIKSRGMEAVFPYTDGVFVRVNPMLGGDNKGTDKDVANYRDILVEADEGSLPDQFSAIRSIGLPMKDICCSGVRSVQGHVRVLAPTLDAYHERYDVLQQYCLESLGLKMDKKNKNPSRYTRLPGGRRVRRNPENCEKILDPDGNEIIDVQTLLEVNLPGKPWDEWVKDLPLDDGDNTEWFDLDDLFQFDRDNDPNSLIGDRWLCKGDSFILQGYTGIGKSSLVLQMAMCWALGLGFFGIKPKKALKILLIQAENNMGDLAEPLQDIAKNALNLTPEEKKKLKVQLVIGRQSAKSGAVAMAAYVRLLIAKHKPDIVIFDPLLSYFGNDINAQVAASEFFRTYLQPVQNETGVILGFVHHLGKPPKSSDQRQGPMLYSGLGSSDIPNWAREIITLSPQDGLHLLDFGKRGIRAGIVDDLGQSVSEVRIQRATGRQCYWSTATKDAVAYSIKKGEKPTADDLLKVIPVVDPVRRQGVREAAKKVGIGRDLTDELLKQLVESGKVSEISTPRKGTNSERKYVKSRDFPNP